MLRYMTLLLLVFGLAAVICTSALGLAGEIDVSRPVVQQTDWPAGVADLLNLQKPVYAFFVNSQDNFYYSGDAAAFNAFMEEYAKLEGIPHTLVLRCGKGEVKDRIQNPAGSPLTTYAFDWYVFVVPPMIPDGGIAKDSPYQRYVTVNLYVGCNIRLDDIKVPANVKVVSGGEIENFIKKQLARSTPETSSGSELGIYLLADEKVNAEDVLKLKLDEIPLQKKPLFTLDDFVCYSWEDHWFKLTPDALKRLPQANTPEKRMSGIPFVLLANGERIYLGGFWTHLSSASFPNPAIVSDEMWLPGRLNWLTIDRAYPGTVSTELKDDDPRNSPVLKKALEAAGKIDACKGLERPPKAGILQ